MTKIALTLVALAALSTASFADRNREDFTPVNGGVTVESAPLAVYGGHWMNSSEGKQGGR